MRVHVFHRKEIANPAALLCRFNLEAAMARTNLPGR
jgi:hypothetical protein